MRKSAELPNLVLAAIGAGTWDLDYGSGIVSHNEVFAKIAGFGDGLLDRSFPLTNFSIHPEDIGDVLQKISSAADTGKTYTVTYRLCREDGTQIWVEGLGRVIERDAEGRPRRMVGSIRDVTDMVSTRQQLVETEGNLSELIDGVPGAIIRCRRSVGGITTVSYVGPKCEEIWGVTSQKILDNPELLWGLAVGSDVAALKEAFSLDGQDSSALDMRATIVTATGIRKRLHLLAAPLNTVSTIKTRTFLILDITEQVRIEDELSRSREIILQSQKMEAIGSLSGGIAHDFNNLLAVILGNLELLREVADPLQAEGYVQEAIAATLRGRDLTRSLLSFARKAALEPVNMSLNEVAQGLDSMIRRTLPENIDVEVALTGGLWRIHADRSLTESTILNLVINARDAMQNGGRLTIETANIRITEEYVDVRNETITPGRYVMIAITDTGEGISPEIIGKVFEPFFTTKAVGKGTGLGLSSVLGFAKQSGGTVRIYSEVGVGTTVKVYFPAVFTSIESSMERKERSLVSSLRGRVLLVEDEGAVRKVIKARLLIEGFDVVEAEHAQSALKAFELDGPFDVVLTDIVMPGEMQGTGLVKALRLIDPMLKAIFMSGYPNEAAIHGNGLRVEDIKLMKPVAKEDLLDALQRVLGEANGL